MRFDLRKSPTGVFDPLTGFRGRHGLHLSSPFFQSVAGALLHDTIYDFCIAIHIFLGLRVPVAFILLDGALREAVDTNSSTAGSSPL